MSNCFLSLISFLPIVLKIHPDFSLNYKIQSLGLVNLEHQHTFLSNALQKYLAKHNLHFERKYVRITQSQTWMLLFSLFDYLFSANKHMQYCFCGILTCSGFYIGFTLDTSAMGE